MFHIVTRNISTDHPNQPQTSRVIAILSHAIRFSKNPANQIFVLSICFYGLLFFTVSMVTFALLLLVVFLISYKITKSLTLSLFLCFFLSLPLAKGKVYTLLLLPKEQIVKNALYDIKYNFPIYFSDLFLGLIIYFYYKKRIATSEIRFSSDFTFRTIDLVFLIFLVIVLIPSIFNDQPWVIILSALQIVRLWLVFSLPRFINDFTKMKNIIHGVVPAVLVFEIAWTILQQIKGSTLGKFVEVYLPLPNLEFGVVAVEGGSFFRSTGTFFEPSILGTFLLMHLTFLILSPSYFHIKSKIQRSAYFLLVVLSLVSTIFTGSRGIYLIGFCIALWSIFYHKKTFLGLVSRKNLFSVGIAVLVITLAFPFFLIRFSSITDLFTQYGSGSYRIQLMTYALRLGLASPLGVGLNLSPYYFATAFLTENYFFDPAYPHNIFFQILAETGPAGLIVFVAFIYLAIRQLFTSTKTPESVQYGASALVFLLCAQLYPIFLNHPEIISFFFLYLGVTYHLGYRSKIFSDSHFIAKSTLNGGVSTV